MQLLEKIASRRAEMIESGALRPAKPVHIETAPEAPREPVPATGVATVARGRPWWRRRRGLIASGMLVKPAVRHLQRDACAICPFRKPTRYRGLYDCSHPEARCGCAGGTEVRLALKATKCPLGNWPTGGK